jgi:hypothetical protein
MGQAAPTFNVSKPKLAATTNPGNQATQNYITPDTDLVGVNIQTAEGRRQSMANGGVCLAQGPDGAQAYYHLASDRFTTNIPYLIKLYG